MVTRSPRAEHIATGIALNRGQGVNAPFVPEAERLLRLFIAQVDRYPTDCLEVEARFPGCLARGVKLKLCV